VPYGAARCSIIFSPKLRRDPNWAPNAQARPLLGKRAGRLERFVGRRCVRVHSAISSYRCPRNFDLIL
jgi:hypothetical protein